MSIEKVWILCPCYFDQQSFDWLYAEVKLELLPKMQSTKELENCQLTFVLVDDSGGQDSSFTSMWIESHPDVQLVSVPFNLGHQGAIVYGLRSIVKQINDSDIIITMDCDGEDSPSSVFELLKASLEEPDNLRLISLATRLRRYETLVFKVMLLCFQFMFLLLTGRVVRTGNFACMRGWFAKNVLNHPFFDHCYSSSLLAMPVKHIYVPLNKGRRKYGSSKMTYVTLISHGIRMLLPFLEKAAVRTMVASALGMLVSFLLFVINMMFWRAVGVQNVLILLTLLSFFVSLACLCTGGIFFLMVNQNRAINIRRLSFVRERMDTLS